MVFDERLLTDELGDHRVGLLYLAHSAVVLRHRRRLLVFDAAVPRPFPADSFLGLCPLHAVDDFDVTLFHSHGHGDHWSPRVLDLPPRPGLRYVLSFDIDAPKTPHLVTVCRPTGWTKADDLDVFAGPSSDEGVAFLVAVPDGPTVYFSGDNAFWDWEACRTAEGWYRQWMQPFIDQGRTVDVAFQVADPRCSETHYGGIHDVSTYLDIGLLVPIHNFGDFSHAGRMRDLVAAKHPDQAYWHVTGNGQYRTWDCAVR